VIGRKYKVPVFLGTHGNMLTGLLGTNSFASNVGGYICSKCNANFT